MRPDEILRCRMDLYGKANSGGAFPQIVRGILSENVDDWSGNTGITDPGVVDTLFASFRAHLKAAYSYRVTPDMVDLLTAAAEGLDESDRFDRNLAPTGCGIIRFDKPLPMLDVRGKAMLVHWLSWGPITVGAIPGVALWAFNDAYTQPDEYTQSGFANYSDLADLIGRWAFIGASVSANGEDLGPPAIDLNEHTIEKITAEGDTPTRPTNLTRYVHALWLLMNQTIVATVDEPGSRHARKGMRRMKMPDTVSVIQLRRSEPHDMVGESNVEWAHRWIVRGHWAWRHCGPDHPQAQPYKDGYGARVWIAPYQKGPEDKPLVVTDKLYDLRR